MNPNRQALIIALIYTAVSLVWVGSSDYLVASAAGDSRSRLLTLQAIKGWLFVLATAALLYWLVKRRIERIAALERAEKHLRNYFQDILETLPYGVEEVDTEGIITFSNRAHAQLLGYRPGELTGRRVWDVVPADEQSAFLTFYSRLLSAQPEPEPYLGRNETRDGRLIDVRVDWTYRRDAAGRVIGFVALIQDITRSLADEARLREAATVFESSAEAIVVADSRQTITAVNRAFERLTGYAESEALGQSLTLLRPQQGWQHEGSLLDRVRTRDHWQGELWSRRRDGELFPSWTSVSAIRDDAGNVTSYIGIMTDLSQVKETQRQLEHLSRYDVLTTLPNMTLLKERLARAMDEAEKSSRNLAVVTIDLDRFKAVNESLGLNVGDAVLREVGQRIVACAPPEGSVARAGGDTFVMVLTQLRAAHEAVAAIECTLAAIAKPFFIDGTELYLTASVGVAMYPTDGNTVETLLNHGEIAANRAKHAGRNTYRFYTAELSIRATERLAMETSLRHAVERGEFVTYYQPQVDLSAGTIVGVEALVRWQHPHLGLLSPTHFVPLAEEIGLIEAIGDAVLLQACRQLQDWTAKGLGGFRMAVNLSASEIAREQLVPRMKRALDASGILPAQLELEITETAIMTQAERAMENIARLRDLGVQFAIDDFGTGYSSMSYLKRFAVHKLKIDGSFVRDLSWDTNDRAIVRAIVALGHSLQLKVIAEGVEQASQNAFLHEAGCDEIQGYYVSVPLCTEDMERLLSARR